MRTAADSPDHVMQVCWSEETLMMFSPRYWIVSRSSPVLVNKVQHKVLDKECDAELLVGWFAFILMVI